MKKPLLMTKVKNYFNKVGDFEYCLRNINVNGVRRGCSGFIKNPISQKIVYINTESSCYQPLQDKILFRTAKDFKDFTGGINHFCFEDELVEEVLRMLT